MGQKLSEVCLDALSKAKNTLRSLGEKGRKEEPKAGEPLTKSDLAISKTIREHFLSSGLPAAYQSEEAGEINDPVNPKYKIFWDELDGTFNYQRGGLLPSTTVISVFDYQAPLRFKDAIFAAIMDLKSENLWYAEKNKGCFFNEKRAKPSNLERLGEKIFLMIDHGPKPSKEQMEQFMEIYSHCWPHNISSAGFHLAGVSSGNFDAYVSGVQKAHELSAGYLLLKESGAYLVDFDGKSLDNQEFIFNKTYQIIAAGNKKLGERLRQKIRR